MKKVCLVFRRLDDSDFELLSIAVDGVKCTARRRGDKSSGKYFQWKPGNGVAALAYFFVRAVKYGGLGAAEIIDPDHLKGVRGHLIWAGNLSQDGSLPQRHPQSIIRRTLIDNRHRSSLYLYRLFYQESFRDLGVKYEDLTAADSKIDVKALLEKMEGEADQLSHKLRQEYDKLIFLSCMLVRREPRLLGGRRFWVYFCTRPEKEIEIEIKLQPPNGIEETASQESLHQLERVLGRSFRIDENTPSPALKEADGGKTAPPPPQEIHERPLLTTHARRISIGLNPSLRMIVAAALLLLLGTILFHRGEPSTATNPSVLETNQDVLTIYNTKGDVLWKKDVGGPIESRNCHIADLDGDGTNEVIVAMLGYDDASTGGRVYVFDAEQNIKWDYALNETSPFTCERSGHFAIREVYVDDYLGNDRQQVLILFYDVQGWCASCACLLNSAGDPMWTFWNPGHIVKAVAGSPSRGERKRIVFEAINNSYSEIIPGPFADSPRSKFPRAIFLLDPLPSEIAPTFPETSNAGFQQLKWYHLISPEPIGLERLDIIDADLDGRCKIAAWFEAGHAFYLNFDGELIGTIETTGKHRDVELVKVFPQEGSPKRINELLDPTETPSQ